MTILKQCEPPIPILTPLGEALCMFIEVDDYDVYWQAFQKETNESWWWRNHYIRLSTSISGDRPFSTPIILPSKMEDALRPHKQRNLVVGKSVDK
jgi:hypothetical protein